MGIQFIDVSIRTMIGQLPKIINNNNKSISDYIDKFYDDDQPRIITSVYACEDGQSVKSNLGEFRNLQVDNIVIGGDRESIVTGVNHNVLENRYLWNNAGTIETVPGSKLSSEMKNYCHNAGSIGIEMANGQVLSVAQAINGIIKDVDSMKSYHSTGADVMNNNGYVSVYGASATSFQEPNSFTFDQSLLFANKVQLKRMNLPQYQYDDITSGFIYTYYDYAPILTINDEHTSSIKGIPGSVVNVKFNNTNKKGFYRILLSRSEKKYLRISKDELVRLSLVCTGNNEIDGTTWEVKDYSVRNADDLIIERK